MSEQWTLAKGIEKLFSTDANDETEIEDLATYGHQITLDISFAAIEVEEIDGVKVAPTKGISVILTADNPPYKDDDGCWMFSRAIFPVDGETLPELAKRIAVGLGINPDEKQWEDGQN